MEHSRKCCASILKTVFAGNSSAIVARQFGKSKIFLTDMQVHLLLYLQYISYCNTFADISNG